jgi:inner membrane protein
MAAARVYHDGRLPRWRSAAFWSALSLLPDADVAGFALGVEYADPWGHRGATHSLIASIVIGLALGLAARWFNRPAGRTAVVATVVLASHGLLDTLTDGGLGCALFWPFDLVRYFAPWRPIPVAPIGLYFFSPYGAFVAAIELVLFSPVVLYAIRSRRPPVKPAMAGVFVALWLASVWLISSGDPVREAIVGFVVREDTAYTAGFSEAAFQKITLGASDTQVRDLLGAPFGQSWFYPPADDAARRAIATSISAVDGCRAVAFEGGVVARAFDDDACRNIGIEAGSSMMEVQRLLGSPRESCWRYSWSPANAHYRVRDVCFLNSRVDTVIRRWN